jgi:hypothetical protein
MFSVDTTWVGWLKSKALSWVCFLAPGLADVVIVKTVQQMSKAKGE